MIDSADSGPKLSPEHKALVPVGVEPRVEPLQNNPPENPSVLAVTYMGF